MQFLGENVGGVCENIRGALGIMKRAVQQKINRREKGVLSMKSFTYTIKDEVGIHARPAGMIAKKAKEFESEIIIEKGGKSASAAKLMALMGLGVKCGDSITVTVQGADEDKAASEMEKLLSEIL